MDKLRILVLEDNAADAELLEHELKRGEISHVSKRVLTREAFEKEIVDFRPDIILADYSLPQFNAMEALLILETKELAYIPFIIVTGTVKEEIAEKCVTAGAWDYVIKDHIMRLSTSIKAAMARREAEKKRAQALIRLEKLNGALLNFGSDPDANINKLVRTTGELMKATCALYNRLDKGMLCSLGQWNAPPGYDPVDKPDGHICYDVIKKGKEDVYVVRDLLHTPYARTDPNVLRYGLKTYIGRAVKVGGVYAGSVCVVYKDDFIPAEEDEEFMGIISSAISVEENRKISEEELKKTIGELKHYKDVTVGRESRMIDLKREINKLSRELGRPEPYDVTFAE